MPKVKVKYIRNSPQAEFHRDISSKYLVFSGGLGSGKTFGLCMKMMQLSELNKDVAGGILCPSYSDYKKDILPTFQQIFEESGLTPYVKINHTDKAIYFPWSKAPLYIFTAEKPIAGPNLGYCGINEFSLIKWERINEMMRRVRVKKAEYSQRCFAGTPEDVHGWFEDYVEKNQDNPLFNFIKGKTTDNEHNDPDYIEHLRSTLDPMQFKLFAEGELVNLNSMAFYYAYTAQNHYPCEFIEGETIYINIDFNVGNMTATICHKLNEIEIDGKKIRDVSLFFDEIVLKEYSSDTYAMINEIIARYGKYKHLIKITCDFSGSARKTTGAPDVVVLRQVFGHEHVRYRKTGNVPLRKRQVLVNGLLSKLKILLNPEKCPTLKKDLKKVRQKADDFIKDKANPDLTHASDTLDYYCDFEYEIQDRQKFHATKAL